MMKISFFILFAFCLQAMLVILPAKSVGQNPFTTRPGKSVQDVELSSRRSPLLEKFSLWQHQLNSRMTALVHESRATGSLGPLIILMGLAFAYGIIHAAGPGHGKAFALSYVAARKPSYLQGVMVSHMITLVHGASGITFVLVVRMILNTGVARNLDQATRDSQLASYGLIAALGLVIFGSGLFELFKEKKQQNGEITQDASPNPANPVLFALLVGCVPCPGVVMVMLFAMSIELMGLGIAMGMAISLGMALTVSLIVVLAITGQNALLDLAGKKGGWMDLAEPGLKMTGGFALAGLGSLFFLSIF